MRRRYDNLIEKFSNHGKIPAIGCSIGVERIAAIYEKFQITFETRLCPKKVYVSTVGDFLDEKLEVVSLLRNSGFVTYFYNMKAPKMGPQMKEATEVYMCDFMVIIGEDEVKNGTVTVKDLSNRKMVIVNIDDLIVFLKQ